MKYNKSSLIGKSKRKKKRIKKGNVTDRILFIHTIGTGHCLKEGILITEMNKLS